MKNFWLRPNPSTCPTEELCRAVREQDLPALRSVLEGLVQQVASYLHVEVSAETEQEVVAEMLKRPSTGDPFCYYAAVCLARLRRSQ